MNINDIYECVGKSVFGCLVILLFLFLWVGLGDLLVDLFGWGVNISAFVSFFLVIFSPAIAKEFKKILFE